MFYFNNSNLKKVSLQYNYDFTNTHDSAKFFRGGKEYIRPCGWYRIGLDIHGKYKDDAWLTDDSKKEGWINTYYPTDLKNFTTYLAMNEDIETLKKAIKDGNKIPSFLDPKEAEDYAAEFDFNGNKTKVLLQCRVNPKFYVNVCGKKVFLCPEYSIRPYGLLLKSNAISAKLLVQKVPQSAALVPIKAPVLVKNRKPKIYRSKHTKKSFKDDGIKIKNSLGGSFSRYIFKVLKQVHPEAKIGKNAMNIMDSMLFDMMETLFDEAGKLVRSTKSKRLTSRDIQTAARLLFPGELAKHAISEGVKAVTAYNNSLHKY